MQRIKASDAMYWSNVIAAGTGSMSAENLKSTQRKWQEDAKNFNVEEITPTKEQFFKAVSLLLGDVNIRT